MQCGAKQCACALRVAVVARREPRWQQGGGGGTCGRHVVGAPRCFQRFHMPAAAILSCYFFRRY